MNFHNFFKMLFKLIIVKKKSNKTKIIKQKLIKKKKINKRFKKQYNQFKIKNKKK